MTMHSVWRDASGKNHKMQVSSVMTMHKGICPECGSTEIYVRSGWFNNIVVMFMPPKTQVYVCGNCGYIAEFIEKGGHLDYIKKNWQRLDVPDKPKNEG